MGNDVMTRPGWLEAMIEGIQMPDFGFASPSFNDHHNEYAPERYVMDFYPHCAMWETDIGLMDEEIFPSVFSDTDLMMRIYREKKQYPIVNRACIVADMINQTFSHGAETSEQANTKFLEGRERFRQKHADIINDHPLFRGLAGYDE